GSGSQPPAREKCRRRSGARPRRSTRSEPAGTRSTCRTDLTDAMARPATITDEQILEAARVVFVRDGVNATTKEIAREAGIAEGSIFRRFPTKDALFEAAVLAPTVSAWARELDSLAGRGDLQENLLHIARGMTRFVHEKMPLIRVAWANAKQSGSEGPGERD